MSSPQVTDTNNSEIIIGQIQKMIIDGKLRPGEKLPSQRKLAEQFSVSRATVKKAIIVMEQRHMVKSRWGWGAIIQDVFQQSLVDPLEDIIKSSTELSADAAEMRYVLEVEITMLAAKRRTLKDLENLEIVYRALELAFEGKDATEQAKCDAEFHFTIAKASQNKIFIHIMRSMMDLSIHDIKNNVENWRNHPGGIDIINKEHEAIYNAVLAGNVSAAEKACRVHLSHARRNWSKNSKTL